MAFTVQVIFSARCNLYDQQKKAGYGKSCPYCSMFSEPIPINSHYTFNGITKPVDRELTPDQWLLGFYKIINAAREGLLIDITGGEPMMYLGLPEVLSGLKGMSAWAITSNTLLTKQIQTLFKAEIDAPKVWTASWHPGANVPIERFIDNLDFIRSHGCPVTVTHVLHSSTKDRIKRDMQTFREHGYQAQIHLYLDRSYALADDTQEMKELYRELQPDNYSLSESWQDGLPGPRNCIAGQRSCTVTSDGKVYLCYEHALIEQKPRIGTWGQWIPNFEITRNCNWTCRFPCDTRLVVN